MGCLFISFTAVAQYEKQTKYLDTYLQSAVEKYNMPSLSIGIVKDGEVIFKKSYGLMNTEGETASDVNSNYEIASLSKAFTTASLGMLVDEGKLNWDDKVIDHLPYFALADAYVTTNMTIRDLCSHRSGLATFDGDLLWYLTDYSREEIIRRIKNLPLKQEFRTEFGYQNIMYITAGEIVEKISGKTWEAFVEERILKELEMNHTFTSFKAAVADNNMTSPHLKGKPIEYIDYTNSGGTVGIYSNVNDMCNWLNFWLNKGINGQDTLLSFSSIAEIHMQQTVLRTSSFDARSGVHFKGYGLGWFLMDYQGKKVIHHGGGLPGFITKVALVPEDNLGMVVLTNDMSSLPAAMMYKVVDVFTEGKMENRDWADEFLGYQIRGEERDAQKKTARYNKRVKGTKPLKDLNNYTGHFEDKMYGKSLVSLKDDALYFEMTPSNQMFKAKLNHWHYHTFQFQFEDPFLPEGFLTFELNSNGEVVGYKIDLPNPDFHFFNLNFEKSKH